MIISYQQFENIDLRYGTIVKVEAFPRAKKPAYKV
jgi:tRNA-binding protein